MKENLLAKLISKGKEFLTVWCFCTSLVMRWLKTVCKHFIFHCIIVAPLICRCALPYVHSEKTSDTNSTSWVFSQINVSFALNFFWRRTLEKSPMYFFFPIILIENSEHLLGLGIIQSHLLTWMIYLLDQIRQDCFKTGPLSSKMVFC